MARNSGEGGVHGLSVRVCASEGAGVRVKGCGRVRRDHAVRARGAGRGGAHDLAASWRKCASADFFYCDLYTRRSNYWSADSDLYTRISRIFRRINIELLGRMRADSIQLL